MNVKEENNVIKLKKDVVKNIAIVFLTVMLLLTFFSNSIMNKSLPEVATQYVQSGTITEKIRGTGIVEADDPYSVMVTDTRVIDSVAVKVGDEVTKDQILFYLQDSESAELEEAQKALEDLILKYTTGALTGEMTDSAYYNATTGKVLGMNTYEAQIEAAKTRVKNAQDTVDSLTRQMAVVDGQTTASSDAEIAQAKLDLEKAQQEQANAKERYAALKAIVDAGDGGESAAKNEYELAKLKYDNAKQIYDNAQTQIKTAIKLTYNTVIIELKNYEKYENTYAQINSENDLISTIFTEDNQINSVALNDWQTESNYPTSDYNAFTKAFEDYINAKTNADSKNSAYVSAKSKAIAYSDADSKLSSAEADCNNANNKVSELQTKITTLTNAQTANTAGNQQLSKDLALKKSDAELELSKAKEAQAQLLTDISKTLDLANQNSIIRDQQEKVAKLKEKASGAVVTSPVDGTILSIAKKAGESTSASDALATIQVAGKAMTMNFSVTAEQAKKVSIGDTASLQNAWYYSDDIRIVLTKIANDPNNPGKNKLLMFNVEGAVSNGESLNVSLGQNPREYSMVVPNSAIREDSHGKFIFTIEEKSTPFGNRYKAKRADVEVITSDDSNTAIKADIDSWSYVITTSNKPIESGQQVRLSDR